MTSRYVLITNISTLYWDRMLINAHALMLEDRPRSYDNEDPERRRIVSAYGTEAAWLVFSLDVDSIEYEIVERPYPDFARYIQIGGTGGPRFAFAREDHDAPLDITMLEMLEYHGDIDEAINVQAIKGGMIRAKVQQYWRAPNFPRLQWERRR